MWGEARDGAEIQRWYTNLKSLPGVILDNCALGKTKEGSTEVHAHRGTPAIRVILEEAQEAEDSGVGEEGRWQGTLDLRWQP